VEETLARRRSIREYADAPLVAAEVGQLLWAAQGTSGARGYRTAPSAGALYPLELYLVAGRVEGLEAGVYHYDPAGHALTSVTMGDRRADLAAAALGQASVRDAAVNLVFVAEFERTTQRYGERGVRYVYMEAGHAAQNVLLQCVSLELGAVVIGAFEESTVSDLLLLSETETPLYIIPVGRPR
jgi:SagB-type dehydrogenase family enzyme